MKTRWARFARGWVVALFSTLVAALSHTVGGGSAPAVLAVVVSLAFAGMVCVGLAGRSLSAVRLIVSVLVSQAIFHALFSFGGSGGALTVDAAAAGAHSHLAGRLSVAPGDLISTTGAALMHASHSGWAMWLAHLTAAAVTIVALRHAEQALWQMLEITRWGIRSFTALSRCLYVPVTVPALQRVEPCNEGVPAPHDLGVFLIARPHRGPPVRALCV